MQYAGWADRNVSTRPSLGHEFTRLMWPFCTRQTVARPLKQAVVGLDFFGFNMFFPRNREQQEARFAGNGADVFADFLAAELPGRRMVAPP